jgi:ribosomal-protein-alanine N-acetyltransferase
MTQFASAAHLAALHRSAFVTQRPWSESEFHNLLATTHCHAVATPHGFALIRVIADECELLTLAVHPDHRNAGLGGDLLNRAIAAAVQSGAADMFLEVAADNDAALSLYTNAGFEKVGARPRYYARTEAESVDAVLMARKLP